MKKSIITLVGLGLIGGSLAKALRRTNPHFTIIGVDTDEENLRLALQDGGIDQAAVHLENVAPNSHIVFLCTPIDKIPEQLKIINQFALPGTMVTDVGSIKSGVMEEVDRILRSDVFFIGGHPMAGAERSGYSASIAHLFENAYYILTPRPGTPESSVNELKHLIASTGALPLILDPITHDNKVGAVSHLPHVIAAALVNTIRESDGPDHLIQKLAAGGFKDITRIASSNPKMWQEISLTNKEHLLPLIIRFIHHLYQFGRELDTGNEVGIEAFYRQARDFRETIPSSSNLYLLPYYQVHVDVEDKPGIIGQVATLLGSQNVNIKNIRIINSREDEPGCLVLSLDAQEEQRRTITVLKQAGYHVYSK